MFWRSSDFGSLVSWFSDGSWVMKFNPNPNRKTNQITNVGIEMDSQTFMVSKSYLQPQIPSISYKHGNLNFMYIILTTQVEILKLWTGLAARQSRFPMKSCTSLFSNCWILARQRSKCPWSLSTCTWLTGFYVWSLHGRLPGRKAFLNKNTGLRKATF